MNNTQKTNKIGETPSYDSRMAIHTITGETAPPKMGRKPKSDISKLPVTKRVPIRYVETIVDETPCMKGIIVSKGQELEFLFDIDDFERVIERKWFATTGGKYISCQLYVNNERKALALHNFIMNKFDFPGKGAKESVDHINRNSLDNRKSNLRITSQTLQNINQRKKPRTASLPEGISDLPRHIWYIKANGLHGDRFCVELKTEGIAWKTTSSKKVSVEDKLKQAIAKRDELYAQFPYLSK